jgi:hypothetical protein
LLPDSVSGGLANLGDINGDGFDDVLVASDSMRPNQSMNRGWIEAYCGKSGKQIWKLEGLGTEDAQAAGHDAAFFLAEAYVLCDIDGDGVNDVYALEAYAKKKALWISGKTGQILSTNAVANIAWFWRPARWEPGDKPEGHLVFVSRYSAQEGQPVIFSYHEAANLKPIRDETLILGNAPVTSSDFFIANASLPDENGDGKPEWLVIRGIAGQGFDHPEYSWELRVICGKTLTTLRSFRTPRPRTGGQTAYAVIEGLPTANQTALVISTSTGEGPERRISSLRAVSLADGEVFWNRLGTELGGGLDLFTIDTAGARSETINDVTFGSAVVAIGDVDGDDVVDLATTIHQESMAGTAIALFSGKDGSLIRVLNTVSHRLASDHRAPIVTLQRGSRKGLATVGQHAKSNQLELLIFEW